MNIYKMLNDFFEGVYIIKCNADALGNLFIY